MMGFCMSAENLLMEPPADGKAGHDVQEAVDDAVAELLEVIEETHARHFFGGALLGCFNNRIRHSVSGLPAQVECQALVRSWGPAVRGFQGADSGSAKGSGSRGMDSIGGTLTVSNNFSAGRILRVVVRRSLLGPLFQLDVQHLGFELAFEFVAGFLELGKRLAQLASQFGKLPRPENYQGQQEDENHLRHAKIHGFIIMRGGDGSKPGAVVSCQLSVLGN